MDAAAEEALLSDDRWLVLVQRGVFRHHLRVIFIRHSRVRDTFLHSVLRHCYAVVACGALFSGKVLSCALPGDIEAIGARGNHPNVLSAH